MEFKNFENKLIIEKITNYCIENNINAQEINSLTAKIKFGKLNESLLLEVDPIIGAAAGAALGAGAKTAYNWGMDKIRKGLGTSTQKYNYAKGVIQQNLQTAITSLDAAHKNLVGNDNIFDKYKIVMKDSNKQDLINAVTQLKTAIDQNIGDVVTSMKNIGGEVSGSSNYGDESPSVDFDIMFPELKNNGDFDTSFKASFPNKGTELVRIKTAIKKNISASLKDKDSSQINALIQKFKQSIDTSIKNLKLGAGDDLTVANPKLSQQAYGELLSLANGKFPASTSTPTGTPAPANPGSNPNTVAGLISNNDVNDKVAKVILSGTNLATITKIIQDAYDKGQSTRDIGKLITKASKQSATMKSVPSTITNKNAAATLLIKNIGYYLENPTAR
jgi:hypothetical protein